MRLLAYGGTEYAERCRIGAWPSMAYGPLEDTYGLSGDAPAFGCGQRDGQLFLIIRQVQKRGQRLYAYSLLIEPDASVWEHFGWNAASIILALFDGAEPREADQNCVGQRLLNHPEEFNEESLRAIFAKLSPPSLPQAERNEALLSVWVGALHSAEPVTVTPQSLGIAARPGIAEIAAAMESLQPCFRSGLGWLVGGSAIQSQTFGAHLVLDDWLTQAPPVVQECIENGDWMRQSWQRIAEDVRYGALLKEKERRPIWQWGPLWLQSMPLSFARVGFLASLLKSTALETEMLQVVLNDLKEDGPLEQEIREVARAILTADSEPLNRPATMLLLHDHFDNGLRLDGATVARLHDPTVVEFYTDARRRIRPTQADNSPRLPPPLRADIWRMLLDTTTTADQLPNLLLEMRNDLDADASPAYSTEKMGAVALSRSLALNDDLTLWIAHRSNQNLGQLVGKWLKEEVCRRASTGKKNWQRDYLAFGQDAGGHHFAQLNIPPPAARELFAAIWSLANSENGLQPDAKRWIVALAQSPLRQQVPVKDKLDLQKAAPGDWQHFKEMAQFYIGANEETGKPADLTPIERGSLLIELKELALSHFRQTYIPNLRGLNSFLNGLSDDVIDVLATLRPKLESKGIDGWMEGWRRLRPEVYQSEVVRSLVQSDKRFQIPAQINKLDYEHRTELFRQLLFDESELDNQNVLVRGKRFIEHAATKGTELKENVAAAFLACETDVRKRDVFYSRYCESTQFLDNLLACLPAEHHLLVVTIIHHRNPGWIETIACRFYGESLKPAFEMTPYRRAVLSFVASPEGSHFKEAIYKAHDLRNASYVTDHLKTLPGMSVSRATNRAGSGNESVADNKKKGSLISRLKKLLFD